MLILSRMDEHFFAHPIRYHRIAVCFIVNDKKLVVYYKILGLTKKYQSYTMNIAAMHRKE